MHLLFTPLYHHVNKTMTTINHFQYATRWGCFEQMCPFCNIQQQYFLFPWYFSINHAKESCAISIVSVSEGLTARLILVTETAGSVSQ